MKSGGAASAMARRRRTGTSAPALGPTHMAVDTPSVTQLSQVIAQVTAPSFLSGCSCGIDFGADCAHEPHHRQVTSIERDQRRRGLQGEPKDRYSPPETPSHAFEQSDIICHGERDRHIAVIVAFVCAFFNFQHEYGVAVLFVVALGFFTMALIDLAREARIALHEIDHYR